jgi:hypothetical protein
MPTNTLDVTADGITAIVRLRSATVGDNMRKSMLASRAVESPLPDYSDQVVAYSIFPRCLACAVDGTVNGKEIKDLTAAEFVELPAEIGEAWLTAALELNPGWSLNPPKPAEAASAEKKD